MSFVTKCFARSFMRRRRGYSCRGRKARTLKDLAHRRLRTAERKFIARGDWHHAVIHTRPVTGLDVD